MRVGIDVGGTNTDAVLMDGSELLAKVKTTTTSDVTGGIVTAVGELIAAAGIDPRALESVMIGTTHFTNAIVERRGLARTAIIRLGLPATRAVEPFDDWPPELSASLGGLGRLVHGGNEFDGRELSPLDEAELASTVRELVATGVEAVALAAVFSPITSVMEERAAAIVAKVAPELTITLSHNIGRIGLLERENAAAINAALLPLATATIAAFEQSLQELAIAVPLYITQNDGTLMQADVAARYPVRTFASGPTNSMRGAAFLSGLQDALVLDVGGTTSDIGALSNGFPRESGIAATIAGVRTNFRMPDIVSLGLGGGSVVRGDAIGPDSVGRAITEHALVFAGDVLTATDLAVAGGLATVGDPALVSGLESETVRAGLARIKQMLEETLDRMKLRQGPQPLIVVGGGSILVGDSLAGISEIIKPPNFDVANAVGAAIAQISGEVDRIYALAEFTRADAIAHARSEATERAARSGARPDTIQIVEVEDVPVAYMEDSMLRVRAKAVGELVLPGAADKKVTSL
jgi:N-methylhydantoinase A/oxoprolinase/acetone carboxylase beta subunit